MVDADLHVHSNMSPDSRETLDDNCLKAIKLGLKNSETRIQRCTKTGSNGTESKKIISMD